MELMIVVQILDKDVCTSLYSQTFVRNMNLSVVTPAMGEW